MQVLYVADDGTTFDTRYECETYEHTLQYYEKDSVISGLDRKGESLVFSAEQNFCEYVMVLRLDNEEAVDLFKERSEREGFESSGINEPGVYIWGDLINRSYEWILIEDVIEEYQEAIKKIEEYKEKVSAK